MINRLNDSCLDALWPTCGHCLVACFLFCAVGCGSSGPEFVPVAGRVTVDGKPVSTGRIEFFPESGRPSAGNIDSEGRYELKTYKPGDGAEPGKYRVTITSLIIPEDGPIYNSFEDEMEGNATEPVESQQSGSKSSRIQWIVPERYANRASSDLMAEVDGGGEDINFELKSKP